LKNFLTRTLTGFFIVLIVLGSIWFHQLSFLALGLLIITGSQLELLRLVFPTTHKEHLLSGLATSYTVYIVSALIACGYISSIFLLLIILPLIVLSILELYKSGGKHFDSISKVILTTVYSTLPYVLMVFYAISGNKPESSFSPEMIVAFFILIWINDTGAYLVGASIGRNKLFEKVSPNKTWEGFAGGLLLTVLASWFAGGLLDIYPRTIWIVTGVLVSVFATFGDLFESLIKRNAGVKDSGRILPGHGGFLDRFDGVTFAFPMVYLYLTFFG
jgi:phosphatidate cytidylyltransferase